MDTYDLLRFLTAQDSYSQYKTALEEIRNGRKRSHWMWFVFPQLKGLGHSYNADYYGIAGADEARAYRQHPVLRERLREITEALLLLDGLSAKQIFGDVDAMKLRSSMTLFWEATREGLFRKVLDKYYEGKMCDKTLGML
uniref:DUF1810 domain-containing protein n=1 Tax=Prevotella sp. TaxID=59823 RepID=UPI00402A3CC0